MQVKDYFRVGSVNFEGEKLLRQWKGMGWVKEYPYRPSFEVVQVPLFEGGNVPTGARSLMGKGKW